MASITKLYAVWKDHKVIGYIELPISKAEELNRMDLGVYFGFDDVTDPAKYE